MPMEEPVVRPGDLRWTSCAASGAASSTPSRSITPASTAAPSCLTSRRPRSRCRSRTANFTAVLTALRHVAPYDSTLDGLQATARRGRFLLTSSFTGYANYMRPLGDLIKDEAAMKRFGNTMVAWDLKAMKPQQIMSVPGAPLEIRWSLNPGENWAVTAAALTSKLWLVEQDAAGQWQAKEVATIGDPAKIPLPVDISITRDGKGLWVNTFMDGMTRYLDLSNPRAPKQTYEKHTGSQVNMISQSWDGKRVYITSSLLANWDKGGADNEQFLRGFAWDGKELKQLFEVDFTREKLGRAHHMTSPGRPWTSCPRSRERTGFTASCRRPTGRC